MIRILPSSAALTESDAAKLRHIAMLNDCVFVLDAITGSHWFEAEPMGQPYDLAILAALTAEVAMNFGE